MKDVVNAITMPTLLIIGSICHAALLGTLSFPTRRSSDLKQKRTMADIRTIATAWEARATDVNRYNAAGFSVPDTTVTAYELLAFLSAIFVMKLLDNNRWKTPYAFLSDQALAVATATQVYS